jgi:geranylgeranyl diphosphate synthase, type II
MNDIKKLQTLINTHISENPYQQSPAELYEPINYLMSLGGKRMRPVLVLSGCDLFNGNIEASLDAAIAIETFHNFTLMHDDIMDKAPLRRGNSTVHEKWNESVAILSGDVMLVKAYQLLMNYKNDELRKILEIFNRTAVEVCEGQQIDMNFEQRRDVTIDQYLQMISLKTAVLLGASLQIGAVIAGAETSDHQRLYEFGRNMGIAFQLQDDLLDAFGDPEKFGKQVGGDIIANKKTYLLIKALELAQEDDKTTLDYWLQKHVFIAEEKVSEVKKIFESLHVKELIKEEIDRHAEKAFEFLSQVNASPGKKDALKNFALDLLQREH